MLAAGSHNSNIFFYPSFKTNLTMEIVAYNTSS